MAREEWGWDLVNAFGAKSTCVNGFAWHTLHAGARVGILHRVHGTINALRHRHHHFILQHQRIMCSVQSTHDVQCAVNP